MSQKKTVLMTRVIMLGPDTELNDGPMVNLKSKRLSKTEMEAMSSKLRTISQHNYLLKNWEIYSNLLLTQSL